MNSSNLESLDNIKKIHFIGIGGSGMFPLAKILFDRGFEITGSDVYESDTLHKVRDLGIKVWFKHSKENIVNQDVVVFSAAIKEDNPEIIAAKENNIPIVERSVMLGIIFKKYKNSISVAGTHGKTTTTSMITSILLDAGKSPTAIIGASLKRLNGNSYSGSSDIIVAEACEYVNSFLQLYPSISVITNIEADHLDYFKTFENIKKSFTQFANQTSSMIIANGDDDNILECVNSTKAEKILFGISKSNNYFADNIVFNSQQYAQFDVFKGKEKIIDLELSVPGKHNVYNALSACIVCLKLGVSVDSIRKSLKEFTGAHRRFEMLAQVRGVTVVDDFAHHPTEIKTTLQSAKQMGFKRVWAIFQPHTYSRTSMLLDDFAEALSIADRVIVSEILPVRETNTYNIHAKDLVNKIENALYIPTFDEISEFISKNVRDGDLILTLGGGNIYKCANMIKDNLLSVVD